jgi:hypothetical protein
MRPSIMILAALAALLIGCAADDLTCSADCTPTVDAGVTDSAPLEPDAGPDDAGSTVDAGAPPADAGELHDAFRLTPDAGTDAGTDAGSDSGPATVDAGPPPECDLVTQVGCGPGQACRRSEGEVHTLPPSGPPHCERAGNVLEWYEGGPRCSDDGTTRACRRGSFCLASGVCAQFCDPGGTACPRTPVSNSVQRCDAEHTAAFDPYCTPY